MEYGRGETENVPEPRQEVSGTCSRKKKERSGTREQIRWVTEEFTAEPELEGG